MQKTAQYHVLRNLVLSHDGKMDIVPDVLRSKSFKGWTPNQIRRLVYNNRKNAGIGEVWVIHKGKIYAREEDLPTEIWAEVCRRREAKIKGVANQNMIYEEHHKQHRPEEKAQEILEWHIDTLGKTMDSSLTVLRESRTWDDDKE